MYEPLHHKVDRVFYEARELKEDVNSEFYYQSNKERQLSSKRSEVNCNEENMNILANKLISSPEKSQKSSMNYDKDTPCSEQPKSRISSASNINLITNLVINSENCKVVIPNQKQSIYQPISILKNRIKPRNPSFPDKCMISYENLKEKETCKTTTLSRNIYETCQYMLDSNTYIKSPPQINWDKQVEGTTFYERQQKSHDHKAQKLYEIKKTVIQNEIEECTFKPNLCKSSPFRRSSRFPLTDRMNNCSSPSPTKVINDEYLNSPALLSNQFEGIASSYSKQYKDKCEYKTKTSRNHQNKCSKSKKVKKCRNRDQIRNNNENKTIKDNSNSKKSLIGSLTERLCMNQLNKSIINFHF